MSTASIKVKDALQAIITFKTQEPSLLNTTKEYNINISQLMKLSQAIMNSAYNVNYELLYAIKNLDHLMEAKNKTIEVFFSKPLATGLDKLKFAISNLGKSASELNTASNVVIGHIQPIYRQLDIKLSTQKQASQDLSNQLAKIEQEINDFNKQAIESRNSLKKRMEAVYLLQQQYNAQLITTKSASAIAQSDYDAFKQIESTLNAVGNLDANIAPLKNKINDLIALVKDIDDDQNKFESSDNSWFIGHYRKKLKEESKSLHDWKDVFHL